MRHDDDECESAHRSWPDALPCRANVWDEPSTSYRRCDEMADPASDSDLCARHEARLTDIVSRITTALTTARTGQSEGALRAREDSLS
jgi:hypothetical protein